MTTCCIFWYLSPSLEIQHAYFSHCLAPVPCQDLPGSWTTASLLSPWSLAPSSLSTAAVVIREANSPTQESGAIKNIKANSRKNLFIVTILSLILISDFSSIWSACVPLFGTWNKGDHWIHFLATCVFLLVPFSSINEHIYLLLIKSAGVSLLAYVHWKKFKWLWP